MYWIVTLSVLIAIECVFAGTALSTFFPARPKPIVYDFFATYRHGITPKYDVLFLRLLIVAGVASFIGLMQANRRKQGTKTVFLKWFTCLSAVMVITEAFFLFKYGVYHYPLWLNGLYVALAFSVLIKIFSPEAIKWLSTFDRRLRDLRPLAHLSIWMTAGGMVLIALIVWVPDVKGAVARMFTGEHLHHMDWLLMPAGWAHLSGNVLGIDNVSRYGIGAPVLVSELTQHFLGGFTYIHAVIAMMIISVAYYWIWFYALRLVLKDTSWAFIAIFLGLRLHFFNLETFPFIFTYPQVTPLRFFWDSVFFLMLILHTQTGRMRWLYGASAVAGFYVFYITGEGLYTLASFYVFLILREAFIIWKNSTTLRRLEIREIIFLFLLPWIVLLTSLWIVEGHHLFEGVFWFNQLEYIRYYEAGNSSQPMLGNLVDPFVIQAAMAFVWPVVYLTIFVLFLGRLMQRTLKNDGLVMAAACVFLLISFHYHAMLANNMPSYLRNGVVIAMVLVFLVKEITAGWGQYHQRLAKLACGVAIAIATVTTHQFLLHPNIFNFSRNPMTHPVINQAPVGRSSYFSHLFISYPDAFKLPVNGLGEKEEMLVTENDFADDGQLRAFFDKETDYTKDVALIRSLTSREDKVPLVSSFENLILMQADRRPFFYTYFMVNSQPRRMRKFPVTVLYTKQNLQREIDRIEHQKPTYIFVESTYLVSPIPQAYLYDNEDLVDLLAYIFNHYEVYQRGEFLAALKRK